MKFVSTKKFYPQLPKNINNYQLDIWNNFLGTNININERFKNPTRQDTNAGAILRLKGGYIRLFDPPSEFHSMTVFEAIMYKYNCEYIEAIKIAWFDILRGKAIIKKISNFPKKKHRCQIREEVRQWIDSDLSYFNGSTQISKIQLEQQNLLPISKFCYTNQINVWINKIPKFNTFRHQVNNHKKIYAPMNRFFLTNMSIEDIGINTPFDLNNKTLIISKNLKSSLCLLNADFPNVRHTINEGSKLPVEIIKKWDKLFTHILCVYDNDLGGILGGDILEKQWFEVTGNKKLKASHIPQHYSNNTYTDTFGQEKIIKDPFTLTKFSSLRVLQNEINELLIKHF